MTTRRLAPVLLACILLFAANAHARTLFVNGGAAQPGDGSSWAAPLPGLAEALASAADGDAIWVAAGTYTPALPGQTPDRTASFRLKPGVAVYGGFKGDETELKRRNVREHLTVLSGDIGRPGLPDDNVFHVVTGADRAVLDGFTVSGGYSLNVRWKGGDKLTPASASAAPSYGLGAGMLNFRAAPVVRNCVFQDNHALMGGAVYNMLSDPADPSAVPERSPRFIDCDFWQNSALAWGGGVANTLRARPVFVSCQFDSNLSDDTGGGMYNALGAAPLLFNSIFRNNEAAHGAGLANEGNASATLYYCTFTGNRSLKDGPAVYQGAGTNAAILLKTVVWDNESPDGDARFHSAPPSVIRAQDAVIQNGYEGKAVFQSNPGLDRKSETMLNNGYKTNGYRFVGEQLSQRYDDMAKYGLTDNLPAFNAAAAIPAPKALLATLSLSETVAVSVAPAPVTPAPIAIAPEPEPMAPALPEPAPEAPQAVAEAAAPAMRAAPTPVETPAPTIEAAQPESLAMIAPPVPPATPAPAPEPAPEPAPATAPEPTPTPEPAPVPEPVPAPEPLPAPEPAPMPEPAPAPEPEPAPAVEAPRTDSMAAMDLDGNGCLTVNETTGILFQQFWRVDHNGDGCVSRAELEKFEARQGKPAVAAKPATQPEPKVRPMVPLAATATAAAPAPVQAPPQAAPATAKTAPAAPQTTAALTPPVAPVPAAKPAPAAKSAPLVQAAPAARPAKAVSGPQYTLFAPIGGTVTYLVDMQGKVAKTWESRDRSTGAVYLLNNGNLLRTVSPAPGEVRTPFEGPGVNGGIIQEVSPRGQIVWEYSYVSDKVRQHHDIEPLPNGNVLILAWELKSGSELEAVGASVRNHPEGRIWAEHIVEVRKAGPRSGYVVWEWHAWDHLVQNTDANAPNYANPVRLPQRMDVNYNPMRQVDWLHANSIDYDPALDQIVLSLRGTSEVWIIDHSTSTEQAATSQGGIMHRGGDILFRWGNPQAYGAAGQQTLEGQHDARWIDNGKPGQETLLIFNNGDRRTRRSDVVEIRPQYYFKSTTLNADLVWSYNRQGGRSFFADHISGAQRLANGNTLICDGTGARLFEVGPDARQVWEYQYQGPKDGPGSDIFRATRIQAGHPGLARLALQ